MAPPITDGVLSIRFRRGVHTIFLFVDPTQPFREITDELLDVLRERYPDGHLTTNTPGASSTTIPEAADDEPPPRVSYAVLANPHDPADGWRDLPIVSGAETPAAKGLKNNSVVAFDIQRAGDEEPPTFLVDWPVVADDEEEGGED